MMLLACSSCNNFRTFRINNMIGEEVRQTLTYPYSYDPVSIQVDSAFAPFDSPEFYNLMMESLSIEISLEAYDLNIQTNILAMRTYERSFSPNDRQQYNEARAELERNLQLKKEATERQWQLKDEIEDKKNEPTRFIGFKASHKYHALDNNLRLRLLHELFIVNKDMNAILGRYDLHNDLDQDIRNRIQDAENESKGFRQSRKAENMLEI